MSDSPGDAALSELLRDPAVRALAAACGATECHLVGGVLRDRLLGLPSPDLDAVVAGRGQEIAERLAAALPARLVPLGGKDFAAYRLVADGWVLDLWDRAGTSLRQDLARRDFTVNAMALALGAGPPGAGEVEDGAAAGKGGLAAGDTRGDLGAGNARGALSALCDPFDGRNDLAARRLRATTAESFTGDPLRILRLARLLVQLPGFTVEPATVELAARAARLLPEIAAERIRVELGLLFAHPDAARGVEALAATGVYPGLWLGRPASSAAKEPGGASAGQDAATDRTPVVNQATATDQAPSADPAASAARAARSARAAIADLAALPRCVAEIAELLGDAPDSAPVPVRRRPTDPDSGPDGAGRDLPTAGGPGEVAGLDVPSARGSVEVAGLDLPTARLALAFLDLPAGAAGAGGAGGPGGALARFREAGYLAHAAADAVAAVLALLRLPRSEAGRRRYLHRARARWATALCVLGARALRRGGAAAARWRREAAALARLARAEGPRLFAPPRLLDGAQVQELLGVPPGPAIGRALAGLTAAQVDGRVRTREEAIRWLQRRHRTESADARRPRPPRRRGEP